MSWLPGTTSSGACAAQPLEEGVRGLELAVPGALGEVARDDGGGGAERGEEVLERLDLRQVGVAAEMQVGEVDDVMGRWSCAAATHGTGNRHQTTRTR